MSLFIEKKKQLEEEFYSHDIVKCNYIFYSIFLKKLTPSINIQFIKG